MFVGKVRLRRFKANFTCGMILVVRALSHIRQNRQRNTRQRVNNQSKGCRQMPAPDTRGFAPAPCWKNALRKPILLMKARPSLLSIVAACVLAAPGIHAETLTDARYAVPVERYGHFALGPPHEYARLTATTSSGRTLTLELPVDEVFEDLVPRRVRLSAGEAEELLAIVSHRASGARLVLIRLTGAGLEISAESAPIGTPMRWLNPVGVADLDGDGRAEIAAVITPHIGGTLKVYQRRGRELVEIAALGGFSNHAYGSAELGLSLSVQTAGGMRLLVPDTTRRELRMVALERGRLIETGRCALPSPVVGALRLVAPREISAGLTSGRKTIALDSCGERRAAALR